MEAIKEATPQTMMVALVRLEPVPCPEVPPGILKACTRNLQQKLAGWKAQKHPGLLTAD